VTNKNRKRVFYETVFVQNSKNYLCTSETTQRHINVTKIEQIRLPTIKMKLASESDEPLVAIERHYTWKTTNLTMSLHCGRAN